MDCLCALKAPTRLYMEKNSWSLQGTASASLGTHLGQKLPSRRCVQCALYVGQAAPSCA